MSKVEDKKPDKAWQVRTIRQAKFDQMESRRDAKAYARFKRPAYQTREREGD